jgi:hypothetical protein
MFVAGLSAACDNDASRPDGPTVTQRVTRDFGRELLEAEDDVPLEGAGTVMRLLRRYEEVTTTSANRYVASIDGIRMRYTADGDASVIWELNVNGIEADVLPADYRLHPGDVVQWDLRDWEVDLDVRATVGSFPETFTRGVFGRRFPVRVICARPTARSCRRVKDELRRVGVAPDGSLPPGRRPALGDIRHARVLVGAWKHWRDRPRPGRLATGPGDSGVFARFARAGDELHLLDWNGRAVRSIGPGSGLVGAILPTDERLLWLVTGVDNAGVERAARAFNPDDLRDAFAIAATVDGVERLPLEPR